MRYYTWKIWVRICCRRCVLAIGALIILGNLNNEWEEEKWSIWNVMPFNHPKSNLALTILGTFNNEWDEERWSMLIIGSVQVVCLCFLLLRPPTKWRYCDVTMHALYFLLRERVTSSSRVSYLWRWRVIFGKWCNNFLSNFQSNVFFTQFSRRSK